MQKEAVISIKPSLRGGSEAEKTIRGQPGLLDVVDEVLSNCHLYGLVERIGSGDNCLALHVGPAAQQTKQPERFVIHVMPLLLYCHASDIAHRAPYVPPPAASVLLSADGVLNDPKAIRHAAQERVGIALVLEPYLNMDPGIMHRVSGKMARDATRIAQAFRDNDIVDNDVRPEIGYRPTMPMYPWYLDWSSLSYSFGQGMPHWGRHDFPNQIDVPEPASPSDIRGQLERKTALVMQGKLELLRSEFPIYALPPEERVQYVVDTLQERGISQPYQGPRNAAAYLDGSVQPDRSDLGLGQ